MQGKMYSFVPVMPVVLRSCAFVALAMFPVSLHAQSIEPDFPESCEFTMAFPSKPHLARRCDPDDPAVCQDIFNFTKVHGLSSTVNFRVSCAPARTEVLDEYSPEVMESALEAMISAQSGVQTYTVRVHEEESYRVASLLGEGKTGLTPMIYNAQIWIGQKSIFSMEGELIGEEDAQADSLFRDILQTLRVLDGEAEGESEVEAETEDAE